MAIDCVFNICRSKIHMRNDRRGIIVSQCYLNLNYLSRIFYVLRMLSQITWTAYKMII